MCQVSEAKLSVLQSPLGGGRHVLSVSGGRRRLCPIAAANQDFRSKAPKDISVLVVGECMNTWSTNSHYVPSFDHPIHSLVNNSDYYILVLGLILLAPVLPAAEK